LPTQQRIVEVIDSLDDQIHTTEQIVAKLKLTRQGLLSDLLCYGVDRDGHPRNPILNRGDFRETALGLLPCDWQVTTCGDLSKNIVVGIVIRPTQYYRSEGIPILRSANVRENGIDVSNLVYMSPSDHMTMCKSAVKPGDLVTVRTGYPGTTAVVQDSLPAANCVDIIITRPGPQVRSDYLARWINSDLGKGQVLRAQGGLAQQHFNVSEMQALLVAVPPLAEQVVIADRAAAMDGRLTDESRTLTKLAALKRGLLSDLLAGRVRLPAEVGP
jgi:type I restriction enzyme S subunit